MDDQPRPNAIRRAARRIRRYFFGLFIIVVALVLAGAYELGRMSVYRAHPELAGAEQAAALVAKVGGLIQLPSEQPTVATINDAASAKRAQPFLANAENGDILIVYPNAREAIVYRPSNNKLVAVGPVDSGTAPEVQRTTDNKPITATSSNATSTKSKK